MVSFHSGGRCKRRFSVFRHVLQHKWFGNGSQLWDDSMCVGNNIKLMVRGTEVSCEEWLKSQRLAKSLEHTIQTRSCLWKEIKYDTKVTHWFNTMYETSTLSVFGSPVTDTSSVVQEALGLNGPRDHLWLSFRVQKTSSSNGRMSASIIKALSHTKG